MYGSRRLSLFNDVLPPLLPSLPPSPLVPSSLHKPVSISSCWTLDSFFLTVLLCCALVRAVNKKVPPLIGPKKGMNKEYKGFFLIFSQNSKVQKLRFLVLSEGPGGFREVRGAYRNHFHLSWYLVVSVVTSYDQKPWGATFSFVAGTNRCCLSLLGSRSGAYNQIFLFGGLRSGIHKQQSRKHALCIC